MKKKEKRMILIIVLVGVLIIAGLLIWKNGAKNNNEDGAQQPKEEFVQVLEDGTKLNVSNKLKEEKTIKGLKIGNIQLTEQNGQSVLLADVRNEGTQDVEMFLINIILVDKEGKEIATIPGIVSPVKAGATVQLNAGITEDYANAYDFKVEQR